VAVIEKSIVIHAPVKKVFELLDDPHRIPEYSPSVSRVEDVRAKRWNFIRDTPAISSVLSDARFR